MAALTKADLEARVHELTGQLRRTETMLEVSRMRCGELFVALPPDIAATLTPIPDWQTRYVVLDRIIDRATEVVRKASSGQSIDDEMEALTESVQANESYWQQVAAKRDKQKQRATRARDTRQEKTNAEG